MYNGDNMQALMAGMKDNTSLEVLDFSDNDLMDQHGELLTQLIKSQSVMRDNEIWQNSLR